MSEKDFREQFKSVSRSGSKSGAKFASVSRSFSTTIEKWFLLSQRYLEVKNKPYKRDIVNQNDFLKHRLSILIGQRGVGKTTIIVQYLLDYVKNDIFSPKILYVPSDHFLLGTVSLYEIADMFSKLGGEIIALDEIHKYSNWSEELKSIYDTFSDLKIVASGSSALKIYKGTHDLSRRSVTYSIQGLSFREFLTLKLGKTFSKYALKDLVTRHPQITSEILALVGKEKILFLFKEYLRYGYYPYFLELNDENIYATTLEQIFHTIIESDLPAVHPDLTGNSIRKIRHLLTYIATAPMPFRPNMTDLKNIIGVGDPRTLKEYLKYLEDANLIRMLMISSSKLKKVEAPEKIYMDNPNQFYALSASETGQNIGSIREVFFLNMLSQNHKITAPARGDFLVDHEFLFEVGGKGKGFDQIKTEKNAYLALDELERGIHNKIPLWLFGFLY